MRFVPSSQPQLRKRKHERAIFMYNRHMCLLWTGFLAGGPISPPWTNMMRGCEAFVPTPPPPMLLRRFDTQRWENARTAGAHASFQLKGMKRNDDNDNGNASNADGTSTTPPAPFARALQLLRTTPPSKSLTFSALVTLCGAALGPFLDSYHSLFGVLSYEQPLTAHLWGSGSAAAPDLPALVTAWWVPELFGLAGFLIGWLYILLDEALVTPAPKRNPSWPLILAGISFFTLQYWLSGALSASGVDRSTILNVMSILAAGGFAVLDRTEAGLWTSAATALGGPAIEVGLITVLVGHGGYHYNDLGETGYFPLWIVPVYFLGGPAVGNLARGFWRVLPPGEERGADLEIKIAGVANGGREGDVDAPGKTDGPRCKVCNDSRAVGCPNCDAQGYYVTYGRKVRERMGCWFFILSTFDTLLLHPRF